MKNNKKSKENKPKTLHRIDLIKRFTRAIQNAPLNFALTSVPTGKNVGLSDWKNAFS